MKTSDLRNKLRHAEKQIGPNSRPQHHSSGVIVYASTTLMFPPLAPSQPTTLRRPGHGNRANTYYQPGEVLAHYHPAMLSTS